MAEPRWLSAEEMRAWQAFLAAQQLAAMVYGLGEAARRLGAADD